MLGKFCSLAAIAALSAFAGCHTLGSCGTRYYEVSGACQKDACQKSVCQKSCDECDGGYRGCRCLSAIHNYFWCSGGCGEVYCGEWFYDPPDCCDPCDDCYGQFVGPRDCCKHKWIIDPSLWLLAIKGKHCRQAGWYDPCGNWHCHGDGDGCCGGCGKGGCGYGDEVYEGEYLEGPMPEEFSQETTIDGLPDPQPIVAERPNRVANHEMRR